jgi:hypothetical protein
LDGSWQEFGTDPANIEPARDAPQYRIQLQILREFSADLGRTCLWFGTNPVFYNTLFFIQIYNNGFYILSLFWLIWHQLYSIIVKDKFKPLFRIELFPFAQLCASLFWSLSFGSFAYLFHCFQLTITVHWSIKNVIVWRTNPADCTYWQK